MVEVEGNAALNGIAAEFEEQWEFDAPRFRDFEQGTPPGESADDWFQTSATRGLVTPIGVKPSTKDVTIVNEEFLEMSSQMAAENQSQPPSQIQKTNVSSQPDPVEAEHVRAVLAHITNNTAATQKQVAGAALVKKPAIKVETKPTEKGALAVPKATSISAKKQQQQPVFVPAKAKAVSVAAAEKKAVPRPRAIPAAAPSSSRPATRAMEKTTATSRTTRSAAPGGAVPAATRARDPPRVRAPSTKVVATKKQPQQQRSRPQITVAKSPFLRSKQRSATHHLQKTKTTEEIEMGKVEQAKKEAAALRRRNARSVGPALQGRSMTAGGAGPSCPPKRAPTEPVKGFNLRTAKRQRVHGMGTRHQNPNNQGGPASGVEPSPWKSTAQRVAEFTTGVSTRQTQRRPGPRGRQQQQQQQRARAELTIPRTPRFATKTRARATRFKPTEEEEASKAVAEAQALKLRQKKQAEMNRNPVVPAARRRSERKALTEFKPFSFATDVRAAQRSTKPAAELPPPFIFGAQENGPVTRSRAHVVTTTATASVGANGLRASRYEDTLQEHQQYQRQQQQDVEYGYNTLEDEYQQRPGSGGSNGEATYNKLGGRRSRRTTAGPMLLGGAVRVLRNEQQQQKEEEEHKQHQKTDSDDDCCTEEQDGMQAIIKAGATAGLDERTTLHNPLFHA